MQKFQSENPFAELINTVETDSYGLKSSVLYFTAVAQSPIVISPQRLFVANGH